MARSRNDARRKDDPLRDWLLEKYRRRVTALDGHSRNQAHHIQRLVTEKQTLRDIIAKCKADRLAIEIDHLVLQGELKDSDHYSQRLKAAHLHDRQLIAFLKADKTRLDREMAMKDANLCYMNTQLNTVFNAYTPVAVQAFPVPIIGVDGATLYPSRDDSSSAAA